MASHRLHAALDGDGAPSTLRKEPPPTTRSQLGTGILHPAKGKLVKTRAVSGGDDFSADPRPSQHQQSGSSSLNRNRLKKGTGIAVANPDAPLKDLDYNPLPASQSFTGYPVSPTVPKNQLPSTHVTSTATTAQTSSARPPPLRTQSYSKRHASFDTPREVPLPSMPSGQGGGALLPTFDDSEREMDGEHYQLQSSLGGQRRSTGEADINAQTIQATPPITTPGNASHSIVDDHGSYFPQLHHLPPFFPRNNSAPTPPHTPSAERVELRLRQDPSPDFQNRSEDSSPGRMTESDDTTPARESPLDSTAPTSGDIADRKAETRADEQGIHMATADSRLSTTSLPLPHAYGAERVTRLPPTSRYVAGPARGKHAIGTLASETPITIPEVQAVQNVSSLSQAASEPPTIMGYRSSFPIATTAGREVQLNPDDLQSLQNTTPGTAFRFSTSSLQRQFTAEEDEEHEAIKRGHTPKLPEIEAPKSLLHPLLARQSPASTASATRGTSNLSTTATIDPEPSIPATSEGVNAPSPNGPRGSNTSPSTATDRASTASGSSGMSSDYLSIAQRASEPQPTGRPSMWTQSSVSRLTNQRPTTAPEGEQSVMKPLMSSSAAGQTSQSLPETNPTQKDGSAGPVMTVDTTPSAYILQASLPGYQRDEITISTRKKRILHVVADGFVSGGGHFERRVSFGYDADMTRVRAEFNGSMLKITVPRRPTPQSFAASLSSSSSATGNQTFGAGGSSMFWRGRSNML